MKKLLVVLLVLGMVAPAMAAEWNWGGTARVMWSYSARDKDLTGTGEDDFDGNNGVISLPEGGKTNMIWANVKASDTISARFEIGQGSAEDAQFRSNFATWNFGAGKLKVGHMEMPTSSIYALPITTNDGPWIGQNLYTFRNDSIQLQFGDLEIAVAKNVGTGLSGFIAVDDPTTPANEADLSEEDHIIPKVEVAYTFRSDIIDVKGTAGYQTYTVENITRDTSESVNSIVAGLAVRANFGPATVAVGTWYAINPANYVVVVPTRFNPGENGATFSGGEIQDAKAFTAFVTARIKATDMVGLGTGVAYSKLEKDRSAAVKVEESRISLFFQVPLTLAQGVSITPEVGAFINGDRTQTGVADLKRGTETYISTKFQIAF